MPLETESEIAESRRLAAIVAIDMVGFSRLMQADEAGTVARQRAIHDQLIQPKVAEFDGRIVKTTGDGALIEFASTVNAVSCAAAIQRQMASREAEIPENRRITYRMGINLGDIISDGDDIFGDGVNVASRLEGLADPGGIHISEAVFNSIKGKLELGFADLGPLKAKNLAEPIRAFRVLLDPADAGKLVKPPLKVSQRLRFIAAGLVTLALIAAGGVALWEEFIDDDGTIKTLLVLPFGGEGEQATHFADAATENLIAGLGRVSGLETASYTLSSQYEGISLDLDELPDDLRSRYILDGSATVDDGQVTYAARLRDAAEDGAVLWEASKTGDPAAFLDYLAELKTEAVSALGSTLTPGERATLEAQPTADLEAYLAFAEAERFRYSGNFFELEKTLPLYERAIQLDPHFIDAQVGYADVNFTIWQRSYNTIRFTLEALEAAQSTIAHILEQDETNPHALGLQIAIKIEQGQWDLAVSEARGAVFLQPDEPWLRNMLGQALLAAGQYDEAREEFATYRQLSPRLNPWERRDLAFQLLLLGDAEQALALMESIPAEEADRIDQYINLSNAYAQLGDLDAAKMQMANFLKETVWNNQLWQQGYFGRYSDPAIFEAWASALGSAGLPAEPLDFGAGREADRLTHDELVELYSEKYEESHTVGPFGMPYSEDRRADGTLVQYFAWMNGQPITSQWAIKGDQFCHSTPSVHVGREECNNVYIEREKSTDEVTVVSNVYSFGVFESAFRELDE